MLAVVIAALLALAQPAEASRYVRYGLQDDAWLVYGPGTLDERIDRARPDRRRRSSASRSTGTRSRSVRGERRLGQRRRGPRGLRDRGIAPVVTLYGAPRWANGGRAPELGADVWVRRSPPSRPRPPNAIRLRELWLVWNEPNQRRWLRPTTPQHVRHADAAEPRLRGDPPRDARRQGRRRRDCAARLDRRRLARRLDPRHGARRRRGWTHTRTIPIRCGRSKRLRPAAATTARRSRWRRSSGSSARSGKPIRLANADLADGVRLPDEPARPAPRRLQGAAGALRQRRRRSARTPPGTSTC